MGRRRPAAGTGLRDSHGLGEYTARNQRALETLKNEHKVEFRPLPDDILAALKRASQEVLEAAAAADPFARKVYDSLRAFQAQAMAWHELSEAAWYRMRR
jgi:TRAP-type mannitol/chloroaromatic compound transport system substrate-binding protein